VFPTENGCPVSPPNWYRGVWQPTLEASGLRSDLKMHDLRKQYASILVRQGRSASFLESVMGYTSAATTLRWYVCVFNDESDIAAKDLDDWLCKEEQDPEAYAA
jgi:site-specific recombinase XerD